MLRANITMIEQAPVRNLYRAYALQLEHLAEESQRFERNPRAWMFRMQGSELSEFQVHNLFKNLLDRRISHMEGLGFKDDAWDHVANGFERAMTDGEGSIL